MNVLRMEGESRGNTERKIKVIKERRIERKERKRRKQM
jgi:hypothetical protein